MNRNPLCGVMALALLSACGPVTFEVLPGSYAWQDTSGIDPLSFTTLVIDANRESALLSDAQGHSLTLGLQSLPQEQWRQYCGKLELFCDRYETYAVTPAPLVLDSVTQGNVAFTLPRPFFWGDRGGIRLSVLSDSGRASFDSYFLLKVPGE